MNLSDVLMGIEGAVFKSACGRTCIHHDQSRPTAGTHITEAMKAGNITHAYVRPEIGLSPVWVIATSDLNKPVPTVREMVVAAFNTKIVIVSDLPYAASSNDAFVAALINFSADHSAEGRMSQPQAERIVRNAGKAKFSTRKPGVYILDDGIPF